MNKNNSAKTIVEKTSNLVDWMLSIDFDLCEITKAHGAFVDVYTSVIDATNARKDQVLRVLGQNVSSRRKKCVCIRT